MNQQAITIDPTVTSESPIYRPQISGGTEKKLKQKINHFTQQWLSDAVIVNANDRNEARRDKKYRLEMHESSLRQLAKIAVDKLIKKLQTTERDWRTISYSKVDPVLKQECLETLRSLALTNKILTLRCVEFWLEKALISYLYHNKARRTRSDVVSYSFYNMSLFQIINASTSLNPINNNFSQQWRHR